MKADKNFKLSKSTKRVLSTIVDKAERDAFKKAMIDAELSYEAGKRTKSKEKTVPTD